MIIGISGKYGVGKDTVAGLIQKHYSEEVWEVKKFATKLKKMVASLVECDVSALEIQKVKDAEILWLGTNARFLMQTLGTEWGRKIIDDNIWVKALFSDYVEKVTVLEIPTIRAGVFKRVPPHPWILEDNWGLITQASYARAVSPLALPNWLVTDVRFQNEADAIKERGGLLIRVERGESNGDTHESETALDGYTGWDWVINNNGTLQDLDNSVKVMCGVLKERRCVKEST